MNPLLLLAISAAAKEAANVSKGYGAASQVFNKGDKELLDKLLAKQANLGYDEREMQLLQQRMLNPMQASLRSRMDEQRNALASQNLGAAAFQPMEHDELAQKAGEAATALAAQEKRANEQLLAQLKHNKQLARTMRTSAWTGGAFNALAQAADNAATQEELNNEKLGQAELDAQHTAHTAEDTGFLFTNGVY